MAEVYCLTVACTRANSGCNALARSCPSSLLSLTSVAWCIIRSYIPFITIVQLIRQSVGLAYRGRLLLLSVRFTLSAVRLLRITLLYLSKSIVQLKRVSKKLSSVRLRSLSMLVRLVLPRYRLSIYCCIKAESLSYDSCWDWVKAQCGRSLELYVSYCYVYMIKLTILFQTLMYLAQVCFLSLALNRACGFWLYERRLTLKKTGMPAIWGSQLACVAGNICLSASYTCRSCYIGHSRGCLLSSDDQPCRMSRLTDQAILVQLNPLRWLACCRESRPGVEQLN